MKELLEFLVDKCQKGLKEAVENCVDTQLRAELEDIRKVLEPKERNVVSPPSPRKTKDDLYNLISMLTDITTPRKHSAQTLCVPLQIRSRRQTRKNLQEIRTQLEAHLAPDGTNEEGGPSETSYRRRICKILPYLNPLLGRGTQRRSLNQNGGAASSESASGGMQENSSSSGGKEPEGLTEKEEKNILGFGDLIQEIDRRLDLKNRRGHVEIGILGMCGSGKTTLARHIYSRYSMARHFDLQIWVSLPHVPGQIDYFNKILTLILKQCGYGVYQSSMEGYDQRQLLRIVRKNLLGKRYLLVLDGLWDADIEWYFELSKALDWQYKYGDLGDDRSKSVVIVTTRQEAAAKTMVGISGLHQIHPLLNQDTWSIFINKLESLKEPLGDDVILMKEPLGDDVILMKEPLGDDVKLMKWIAELRSHSKGDDHDMNKVIDKLRAEIEHDDELKREIMTQCDGLPSAAVTLAKIIPMRIHQQRVQSEVVQAVSLVEVVST